MAGPPAPTSAPAQTPILLRPAATGGGVKAIPSKSEPIGLMKQRPFDWVRTPERQAKAYGLQNEFEAMMRAQIPSKQRFGNIRDAIALKQHEINTEWWKLSDGDKALVNAAIENRRPVTDVQSTDAANLLWKLRDFWATSSELGGAQLHDGVVDTMAQKPLSMPRASGQFTLQGFGDNGLWVDGYSEPRTFQIEADAVAEGNSIRPALGPTGFVRIRDAFERGPRMTLETNPIRPHINFEGPLPGHATPADGIAEAAIRLAQYRYGLEVQPHLDGFRRIIQTQDNLSTGQKLLLDDNIRRSFVGIEGEGPIARNMEWANRLATSAVNSTIGRVWPGLQAQTAAAHVSRLMTGAQYLSQLTTISENFNRYAETYIQMLPETQNYSDVPRIEAMMRTDGQWVDAMAIASGVTPLTDPRAGGIGGVLLAGHRRATQAAFSRAMMLSHEARIKQGARPDIVVKLDPEALAMEYALQRPTVDPSMTETPLQGPETHPGPFTHKQILQAFERKLADLSAANSNSWLEHQTTGVVYTEAMYENAKRIFGEDAVKVGTDWTPGNEVELRKQGFVPIGGALNEGVMLDLMKYQYLRWPGFDMNVETLYPNFSRLVLTYSNPRVRHAQHVYDMFKGFFNPKSGDSMQEWPVLDPAARSAIVDQMRVYAAARRRLPFSIWAVNRTVMAGASGALGPINFTLRHSGNDELNQGSLDRFFGHGNEKVTDVSLRGILSAFGVDMEHTMDNGVIPFEKIGPMMGLPYKEGRMSEVYEVADYFYNMLLASGNPGFLYETGARIIDSQHPWLSAAETFGLVKSGSRAYRAIEGLPDVTGGKTFAEKYGKLSDSPKKYGEVGPPKPERGEGAYSREVLLLKNAPPPLRAAILEMADEAVRLNEITPGYRDFIERSLKTFENIPASAVHPVTPKPSLMEITGFRPTHKVRQQEALREAFNAEPRPTSEFKLGDKPMPKPLFWLFYGREDWLNRQVVIDAEGAAKLVLSGQDYQPVEGGIKMPGIRPNEIPGQIKDYDEVALAAVLPRVIQYMSPKMSKSVVARLGEQGQYDETSLLVKNFARPWAAAFNNYVRRHAPKQAQPSP